MKKEKFDKDLKTLLNTKPINKMNPKLICNCPFGNPNIAIAENCPIHNPLPEAKKEDVGILDEWDYEIIPNEGEIHIFENKDKTVAIASIYSQPLGHEEYERAKLICSAPRLARENEQLKGVIQKYLSQFTDADNQLKETSGKLLLSMQENERLLSSNRELKKYFGELEKEIGGIYTSNEKINRHTWETYKEQISLHLKTCYEILRDIDNNTKL